MGVAVMADDEDGRAALEADFAIQSKVLKDNNRDERLSPNLVILLQFLAIRRPGATPGEIGTEFEMESAHTAKVLKTLREAGYVHPIDDKADGRVKHYYNTLKGSAVVATVARSRGHEIAPKDLPHVEVSKPKIRGS